jgi:ribonuclease D
MAILTAFDLLHRLRTEEDHLTPTGDQEGCDGTSRLPPVASVSTYVETEIVYIAEMADLVAHVGQLAVARALGLDLETTGLDPHADAVRLVTLAADGVAYVTDAQACEGWADVVGPLLADSSITKVLHNAAFDLQFLLNEGVDVRGIHDTMLAAQLLDGGQHLHQRGHFTLGELVERELGQTLDKALQTSNWSAERLTAEQIRYAALDAIRVLDLYMVQRERLANEGLTDAAALEHAALPALAWLGLAGAPFDGERWADLSDRAVARQVGLSGEI